MISSKIIYETKYVTLNTTYLLITSINIYNEKKMESSSHQVQHNILLIVIFFKSWIICFITKFTK
jgi:hypothetical protein